MVEVTKFYCILGGREASESRRSQVIQIGIQSCTEPTSGKLEDAKRPSPAEGDSYHDAWRSLHLAYHNCWAGLRRVLRSRNFAQRVRSARF